MNWILDIPMETRLAVLFLAGVMAGALVNLAIDLLGWQPKGRSPWSPLHPRDGGSRWLDRLPVLGWLRLARKADVLGPRFWVRPLCLELLTGALVAGLYWWEIGNEGLLGRPLLPGGGVGEFSIQTWTILHVVYASHVLLVLLMLVASFIDIDDRIIPDSITVPGTLAALVLSGTYTWNLMPGGLQAKPSFQFVEFVTLVFPSLFPEQWPPILKGFPQPISLLLGLACFWGWCLALLPRLWLPSRGFDTAVRMLVAHAMRSPVWPLLVTIALAGTTFIVAAWFIGLPNWAGLLTSLVGLAMSGGLVWGVRIVGTWALKKEAMGFGDVTLMAMIGSFLGWQAGLMIFFLAPFAGVVVGVARLLLRREREFPYGPFLCLATLAVIVGWRPLWDWLVPLFDQGLLVPLALLVCLAVLALLLWSWRIVTEALTHARKQAP
ncbi:MAG: A24 family peptidase [Pirellulales bacterium]